jgi:hypothetical protein
MSGTLSHIGSQSSVPTGLGVSCFFAIFRIIGEFLISLDETTFLGTFTGVCNDNPNADTGCDCPDCITLLPSELLLAGNCNGTFLVIFHNTLLVSIFLLGVFNAHFINLDCTAIDISHPANAHRGQK